MLPERTAWARKVRRAALALISLVSLGAISWIPAHATPRPAASIPTVNFPGLVGINGWVPSLDPAHVVDGTSMEIIYKVNSGMLHLEPGAQWAPGLATFKLSKDKMTYTFTLRKGLRFSNGDPLTATDVVFSIRRDLAHATGSPTAMTRLGIIEGAADYNSGKSDTLPGVMQVNKYTVRIRTILVDSTFPLSFAIYPGQILDHKVLQGKPAGAENNYLTNTCSANVGAGPFKFVCRNNSSDLSSFFPTGATPSMTLVPNPYYYGPKPQVKLFIRAIKDTQTAYLEYQAGQLDATPLPSGDVAPNQKQKGFFHFPSTLVNYLSPAVDLPPFDNVHCRLALAYGINTAQIDKNVLHGTQSTLYDMVPKGLVGYYDGKGEPQYNPTKAKSELAQCPGGISNIKLTYPAGSSDNDLVYAGAIPAQLAALGMDVKGNSVPASTDIKLSTSPQKSTNTVLHAAALGASSAAITCRVRQTSYVLNTSDWSNPAYDALCQKALRTFDPKKQAVIWKQAQHMALQQGTWISVGQVQNFYLAKPWLQGLQGDTYYSVLVGKSYDWSHVSVLRH
jgi:ABC-type transport system substrate-binding protein